ncbi:MAG: ABC transporter ATP-binding protein [Bacillota bacterium]
MIEVSNLSKIYPNQKGIAGISFKVSKGEILGLLGPNGAGKTTTMRLITGYLYPGEGTVKVGGYDILDNPLEVKRQIGYLPENPPLYPEMSVTGFLEFAASLKGVKKTDIPAEIDRVAELAGLSDVRRQLIGSLSKGYKQRVGLAQALLNSPPVLVLDEPTVGLDPKQIIEIRNLIKSLAGYHTIILSSHILPEVNAVCGRVIIIDKGRLVAMDTPEGLSRQLSSRQRVEIEARGARDDIGRVLSALENQMSWSYLEPRQDLSGQEIHRYAIQGVDEGDIREVLFKAFTASGLPLLEIRSVNLSLEEIFLHLTMAETAEEAAGETDEANPEHNPAGNTKGGMKQ